MAPGFLKPAIAASAILVCGLIGGASARAQIATDGTVGPRGELGGPEFDVGADLGRQEGRNLFHSFDRFSLAAGERATFSGPDQIRNVISRVTGGEQSDIDGTLRSTIAGADFYFVNPAGVLFGPNASLDVPGSFHVSTADELRFRDGTTFSADLDARSSFTVARPEAFGFLGGDRGTLSVTNSQLRVHAGEAISLVGGAVTIASGSPEEFPTLDASRGTITVGAVGAGGGQFAIRSGQLEAPDRAPITIADAVLNTTGAGGGTIRIEGGRLVVDNTFVFADNNGSSDATGGIEIEADRVTLRNGSIVRADALASGDGGDVRVAATRVAIRSGSFFGSDVHAGGNGGSVNVEADRILIAGDGAAGFTGMGTDVLSGAGQGGETIVHAGNLRVLDGGQISVSTFGEGNAGELDVTARDQIVISGGGQISGTTFAEGRGASGRVTAGDIAIDGEAAPEDSPSGIFAGAEGAGHAGTIVVSARSDLTLVNGGQIRGSSLSRGNAGSVEVHADTITIDGADSRIASQAGGLGFIANAGAVDVTARDQIIISGGGQIGGTTFGEGRGGSVRVTAGNIIIDGEAAPERLGTGIFAGSEGAGQAGAIVVSARNDLTIVNGGEIRGSAFSRGNAGSVEVRADTITIDGAGSRIASEARSTGNAGEVDVTARDQIVISRGGQISGTTVGEGRGGSVRVTAGDITIDGESAPEDRGTGIFAGAVGAGDAGAIVVSTRNDLTIVNGGEIRGSSFSRGNAGSIEVHADTITIRARGQIASEEGGPAGAVTVRASDRLVMDGGVISTRSEAAGGGEIQILVGDVIDLQDSEISTSVGGGTDPTAGNILIDPKALVIDGSRIQAIAPAGFGGTVTIVADNIVVPGGDFDALLDRGDISASGGDPTRAGTIAVNAPELNLAGDLVILQAPPLDAAALLRLPCGARQDVGTSSFTAAGRGGLPAGPNAPLPSAYRGGETTFGSPQPAMLELAACASAP